MIGQLLRIVLGQSLAADVKAAHLCSYSWRWGGRVASSGDEVRAFFRWRCMCCRGMLHCSFHGVSEYTCVRPKEGNNEGQENNKEGFDK
jgi:hypothetical protein